MKRCLIAHFTYFYNKLRYMLHRFRSHSRAKKSQIIFLWITLTFLIFFFISNRVIRSNAEGKTFSSVEKIPANEVGLLLVTWYFEV